MRPAYNVASLRIKIPLICYFSSSVIKKLSNLHLVPMKMQELLLFTIIPISLLGKDQHDFLLTTAASLPLCVVGYFSFVAEKIFEKENDVRGAYYSLNWFEMPAKTRKLLLLAMQKPKNVKIAGFFSYDHASLERFAVVVHRAYDFGLILLEVTKK